MHFNPNKCFVLRIPSSRSPIITTPLETQCCKKHKTHTYLGVDIQHDLEWNNHINRITSTCTASKTLGFVRRNLHSCTKDTKAQAYKMVIRPSVEYCSAVWDPYTNEHILKIGKIQRRAARLVCNNYDWRQIVTELIQKLEWDMLSTRRKINRLSIFNKAIGGHLAIPVRNYLQPAQRQTRRSKSNNYIEHQASLDCYKYSFIPRTIRDWNNLPTDMSSISEPILFKQAVTKYTSEQEKQVRD